MPDNPNTVRKWPVLGLVIIGLGAIWFVFAFLMTFAILFNPENYYHFGYAGLGLAIDSFGLFVLWALYRFQKWALYIFNIYLLYQVFAVLYSFISQSRFDQGLGIVVMMMVPLILLVVSILVGVLIYFNSKTIKNLFLDNTHEKISV